MTKKYKNFHTITEPSQPHHLPQQNRYWLEPQEHETQAEAKMCLFDINKDVQIRYQPSVFQKKSRVDNSLSEWRQNDDKQESDSLDFKKSIVFRRNKNVHFRSKGYTKQKISVIQKSLIEPQLRFSQQRDIINKTEVMKCNSLNKRMKTSNVEISNSKEKIKNDQAKLVLQQSNFLKQIRLMNQIKVGKKDSQKIQWNFCTHCTTDRVDFQKLPKLQRMQPKGYKTKYRSIFRSNNAMKLAVPVQSPLKKDLNKIYQLISSENVKLIKPFLK